MKSQTEVTTFWDLQKGVTESESFVCKPDYEVDFNFSMSES